MSDNIDHRLAQDYLETSLLPALEQSATETFADSRGAEEATQLGREFSKQLADMLLESPEMFDGDIDMSTEEGISRTRRIAGVMKQRMLEDAEGDAERTAQIEKLSVDELMNAVVTTQEDVSSEDELGRTLNEIAVQHGDRSQRQRQQERSHNRASSELLQRLGDSGPGNPFVEFFSEVQKAEESGDVDVGKIASRVLGLDLDGATEEKLQQALIELDAGTAMRSGQGESEEAVKYRRQAVETIRQHILSPDTFYEDQAQLQMMENMQGVTSQRDDGGYVRVDEIEKAAITANGGNVSLYLQNAVIQLNGDTVAENVRGQVDLPTDGSRLNSSRDNKQRCCYSAKRT